MNPTTIILGIVILGLLAFVFVLMNRMSAVTKVITDLKDQKPNDSALNLLNQNMQGLQTRLDQQSQHLNQSLQKQFGDSTKIIQDVTERLTKLDETNKQVVNFSDQLRDLQDILQNPKQRGELGEFFLEQLLENVLPPTQWQAQYKFKDGEIVDAVVFVKDKQLIPIDAKFSLENYNRLREAKDPSERERLEKVFKTDVKNRIDETSKYVRPEEGTLGFAFMFIPAEAIYYDLLVNKIGTANISTRDLIDYAFREKKVIIVSPTSFLAYLQTVMQGLRAMKIEESAAQIRTRVEQLGKHIISFDGYMQKLGSSMATTVNHYNAASKELKKIDKDVVKITEGEETIEAIALEKPNIGEE